jgi:hypothetical protein
LDKKDRRHKLNEIDSIRERLGKGCTMHRNLRKAQPFGTLKNNLDLFISYFSIESSKIKYG